MASRLITTHRSFCYKVELNSCRLSFPSSNPHVNFCIPAFVSCRGPFTCLKLNHCLKLRASSEGLPSELVDEDSKFVPLNAEDPRYGPPALLLLGFDLEEAVKIQQLLKELDGDFLEVSPLVASFSQHFSFFFFHMQVKEMKRYSKWLLVGGKLLQTVIFCTEDMITCCLWEAMNTKQPNLDAAKIAKSLPRICFLSGLTGEEMMMFIDAFPESGLEPPVFAALVPNSADKPIQELIEEIMGDHEMIASRKST
nr:uncharacterized protein LOC113725771 isoform X1 [Coffea arabica]